MEIAICGFRKVERQSSGDVSFVLEMPLTNGTSCQALVLLGWVTIHANKHNPVGEKLVKTSKMLLQE